MSIQQPKAATPEWLNHLSKRENLDEEVALALRNAARVLHVQREVLKNIRAQSERGLKPPIIRGAI